MQIDKELDARGMNCPLPILKAKKALAEMASGQVLRVVATDAGSLRDFHILVENIRSLNQGGVVLNFGSAVILPEVFLKALNLARNLGNKVKNFTTANFDMIFQYRPNQNVVTRPAQSGGKGYYIVGHHEIMLPLLAQSVIEKI